MHWVTTVLPTGELELPKQGEQEAAGTALYVPATQSVQVEAPAAADLPAAHERHSDSRVAPVDARYFPAPHIWYTRDIHAHNMI